MRFPLPRRHPAALIAALLASVIGVSLLILCNRYAFLRGADQSVTIHPNIYINGVPVGGLTKNEAEARLRERFQPALDDLTITLTNGDATGASLRFKDFEARYDFAGLIDQAWRYGREGGAVARYRLLARLADTPYAVEGAPAYHYDAALVETRVAHIAEKVFVAPVNARFRREGNMVHIVKGREGKRMDTAAAAAAVRRLLDTCTPGAVAVRYESVPPAYASPDLVFPAQMIASCATYYRGAENDPRNINLRVAAERINNTMLYPGETFSASAALGPVSPENGYARATVIVAGKAAEDYGGGVCQAVTTLYNAALYAELPVTERFNHSLGVSYVEYGYDATMAGDYFDLKFTNDTPHPMLMVCDMAEGLFTVGLYGYEVHSPGRDLRFESVLVETIPPVPDKSVRDEGLPPGQTAVVTEARDGYRYELYKNIYVNGQITGREKVNTSVYKPVQGVIHVGG